MNTFDKSSGSDYKEDMKNNAINQYMSVIGSRGGKKTLKIYGKKHFKMLSDLAAKKRKESLVDNSLDTEPLDDTMNT